MGFGFIYLPCLYTALSIWIMFNVQGAYAQAAILIAILPIRIIISRLIRKGDRRRYRQQLGERLKH